jgi:c-di-GMP-binding flagellar brake protein YcgR
MSTAPINGSEKVSGRDRRRWDRCHIDVQVKAKLGVNGEHRVLHGRGTDLSCGGVAAVIAADLVIGQTIDVEVTLPYTTQPVRVRATVRNRDSYRYGLQFVNLSPADQKLIQQTCTALALLQ